MVAYLYTYQSLGKPVTGTRVAPTFAFRTVLRLHDRFNKMLEIFLRDFGPG